MEATVVKRYQLAIALALIAISILLRVLPHPANFAPVTALTLFGGAVLPRRLALLVPLGAMVISDTIIGWYNLMPVTWACYMLIALASSSWLRGRSIRRGVELTVGASVFFFVVTNFAVWAGGGLYPHTLAGLQRCFVLALPFFRNTALSDALYTASLFSLYALATRAGAGFFYTKQSENAA
jgi:hypothetical protein